MLREDPTHKDEELGTGVKNPGLPLQLDRCLDQADEDIPRQENTRSASVCNTNPHVTSRAMSDKTRTGTTRSHE